MAASIDIIQIEPHDDVTSVRDRLSFVETRRVLLVWPESEEHLLRRKLDLVLLQREAYRQAARLALVTSDQAVIDNARDLNISTFTSVTEAERSRWKRGRSRVFVSRSDKPEGELTSFELREIATRRRSRFSGAQLALRRAGQIIVLLALSGILLGIAFVFLPSATITIVPVKDHLDVTIRVVADPAADIADLENSVIPATLLTVEIEESATFDTTGSADAAPTLARGTIVFTNQADQAVTIPAGTTVNTSAGTIVRFRTLEPVNIAGQRGAIAAVAIEALPEFAGEAGNVPAYAINHIDGPLRDILTVQNLDPITGGTIPTSRIVSQADHDRLLASVRGAIQQRALGDLTPLLGDRQAIIPESIRILETRPEWTSFSADVGDAADTISLTMRALVQAAVLDGRMVDQVALAGLVDRIPPEQSLLPETITFSRGEIEQIGEDGSVTFQAHVESDTSAAIDIERIKQALAGLSSAEAASYLTMHLNLFPNTSPDITTWPAFYDRMPVLPIRITIVVQGAPAL